MDSAKYADLQRAKHTLSYEDYARKKSMLDGETIFNQKTWLGERFNAGLSTREDRIIDGRLFGAFSNEPLLTIYERGRAYRFEKSSPHDRLREKAEIDGFLKMERVLADPETPVGTMMLSISPSGGEDSDYKHNFYDVFTLKERDGTRYVEASRFSSALNYGEYMQAASLLQSGYFEGYEASDLPLDAYFLTNPLIIPQESGIAKPEDLHAMLHKEHKTLSKEGLEYIFKGCDSLFLAYVALLEKAPWDSNERNRLLNTILNKADYLEKEYHRREMSGETETVIFRREKTTTVQQDIARWADQSVREVTTGCGFSGGFSVDSSGTNVYESGVFDGPALPFSVMDFGIDSDKYGKRSFYCSNNHLNIRPYNTLIPRCQTQFCEAVVSC